MKESPTTVTKKQGWGGKRAGSGRKPGPYAGTSKVTTIVLTAALIEKLHKLGGGSENKLSRARMICFLQKNQNPLLL